jgi:hypothetical protein
MLENKGVESWNDGLSLQFESDDLKEFREYSLAAIGEPFSKLGPQNNWESLLGHMRKSNGTKATAAIVRRPLERKEENVCRWRYDPEGPRVVTCSQMYLVLSNPSLTNPHERYRKPIFPVP